MASPRPAPPWRTPFTPERSIALDRVIVALEAARAEPARQALRRLKAALEPLPRPAVRQ